MLRWQPTANCQYETLGAVTATSEGTQVTGGASANAKGSWVDIGSATTFGYHMLWVSVRADDISTDWTYDIGINTAGNRFILCPDLRLPSLRGTQSGCHCIGLPVYVPTGSQLSVRCAGSVGSKSIRVVLIGGSVGHGGMPGYHRMEDMYTPALSRGTDIDPTVINTKTAWVEITSGISVPVNALLLCIGPGDHITRASTRSYLVDVAIGASGSEQIVIANFQLGQDSLLDAPKPDYIGPFPISIPVSTRLAVRAQISDVTASERKIDVSAWGFVA